MRIYKRISGMAAVIAVLLLLANGGCGGSDPAKNLPSYPAFEGRRALEEIRLLVARGPRDAGTPGARDAAVYLRDRLQGLGWEARLDSFTEPAPGGPATFHNVLTERPGRGEGLVVLVAHFDTKRGMPAGFQGANDSGSGVGVLLELARILPQGPPLAGNLLIAMVDGEECRVAYGPHDGLHGSRRLARQLVEQGRAVDVRAVIVLDMVGDSDLDVTLPANSTPALLQAVFAAARRAGHRSAFGLYDGAILDDHVPFLEHGMPAVDVIDFHYGSAPGRNDYWHTAADNMQRVSAGSLGVIGEVMLEVLTNWVSEGE